MHPQKIKIRWQSNPDMSGQKEHYIYIASLCDAPGQGAQIMRNEAYLRYAAVSLPRRKPGKDAAERSPDESGFTKPSRLVRKELQIEDISGLFSLLSAAGAGGKQNFRSR